EDIKVEVEKNVLKVKAAKGAANPEETTKYLRREFHYTSFERAFTLPDAVDTTKIVANYEQGVLSLNLPKYEAEVMPGAKLIDIV
ncbi:MAG: Hsp20/alpha crystallin family protein, partial [Bacteroidota bacterium]